MAQFCEKAIRQSLIDQLEAQNKTSNFFIDLANDYVAHWKIKKKLIADINKKGVRYETTNGNGYPVLKANESVASLQKETAIMLKLLNDLNLKEPIQVTDPNDGYC